MGATHNYKNSRAAKLAIYELGEDIKAGKLPAHFGPLSFVFTGSGNVSQVTTCMRSAPRSFSYLRRRTKLAVTIPVNFLYSSLFWDFVVTVRVSK